jgi:hypothetical protein
MLIGGLLKVIVIVHRHGSFPLFPDSAGSEARAVDVELSTWL